MSVFESNPELDRTLESEGFGGDIPDGEYRRVYLLEGYGAVVVTGSTHGWIPQDVTEIFDVVTDVRMRSLVGGDFPSDVRQIITQELVNLAAIQAWWVDPRVHSAKMPYMDLVGLSELPFESLLIEFADTDECLGSDDSHVVAVHNMSCRSVMGTSPVASFSELMRCMRDRLDASTIDELGVIAITPSIDGRPCIYNGNQWLLIDPSLFIDTDGNDKKVFAAELVSLLADGKTQASRKYGAACLRQYTAYMHGAYEPKDVAFIPGKYIEATDV